MGLEKKYTLPTFSFLAYMLSQSGKDQFNQHISPHLSKNVLDFKYVHGVSPLSEWYMPIIICFSYLASIRLLQTYMQGRKSFTLTWLRIVHNAFLCFGSFVMVLGMATELVKAYQMGGNDALYCDEQGAQLKTALPTWYYIFYLSKFYEFIDTYILILRKKPVSFLHSFHHFITAYVCWLALYNHIAIGWVTIMLNGTVHVFMYYYYLAVSFNSDLWWKKYLTTMQITQFAVDVLAGIPFFYAIFAEKRQCTGNPYILLFTDAVLISFLILFVNFYRHAYKKSDKNSVKSE